MSGDVYVSFGAQTGELEAAMARTKAEMAAVAREMRTTAVQMQRSGVDMDSTLGQTLKGLGDKMAGAKSRMSEMKDALGSTASASKQTAAAVEEVSAGFNRMQQMETVHVLKSIFDEMAAGQSPMRAIAMEGGRIAQIFSGGGIGLSVAGIGAALLAAGAAAAYFALQLKEARDISTSMKEGLAFAGRGMSDEDVKQTTDSFKALTGFFNGFHNSDVEKLVGSLRMIPGVTKDIAAAVASDMQPLAERMGITLPAAGAKLVEALSHPADAAKFLSEVIRGDLTSAEQAALDSANAMLDPHAKEAAILQILAEAINRVRDSRVKELSAEEGLLKAQEARNNKAGKSDEFIVAQIRAIEEEKKKIEEANAAALKLPETIRSATSNTTDLASEFDKVLQSVNGAGGGIDDLQKKLDLLRQGLGVTSGGDPSSSFAPTGNASEMVKHFEGYQDKSYWDVNHYRVGYGSDTTTDASGGTHEVTAATTTTREDAERDLARRVAEFGSKAAQQVGDAWGKLSDHAQASLTSVAYNYGKLPADVAAAARTGDSGSIAAAIRGHERDNGGVNSSRRAQEAANIGAADLTPDQRAKGGDAFRKTSDDLLKAREAAAGGSAIDKAQLAAAEAEAAGKGDALKAQEAIVSATEHELSLTSVEATREQLRKQLAEERVKLTNLENAAKEAGLKLELSRVSGTGDIDAEHNAATKLSALKMSAAQKQYGAESAQYKAALQEKEAADDKYNVAKDRLAKAGADEEIRVIHDTVNEKRRALDDDFGHHRMSASSYLASVQALSAKEIADVKALYDKEAALDNQTADQKRAIATKLADDLRRISGQTSTASRRAADETEKDWGKAADSVFGEMNSALKGIATGHETARQAAVHALEGIAEASIKAVEKMIVNWALGAAAHKALNATEVSGDAGRAAAGAYAATAGIPLIGPILAPIAAGAAFAGTMAFGSMDIGAYNIPENQMALVHKNELVMPAAQAGAFRDMLDDRASGAGSGGGADTHVHLHVHSMDTQSGAAWLKSNNKAVIDAVRHGVRKGNSL